MSKENFQRLVDAMENRFDLVSELDSDWQEQCVAAVVLGLIDQAKEKSPQEIDLYLFKLKEQANRYLAMPPKWEPGNGA